MTDITSEQLEACAVCKTHRVLVGAGKLPDIPFKELDELNKGRVLLTAMNPQIVERAHQHMQLRNAALAAVKLLPPDAPTPQHIRDILNGWEQEIKAEKQYLLDQSAKRAHVDLTPGTPTGTERPNVEYFGDCSDLSDTEKAMLGDGGIAVENTPEGLDAVMMAADKAKGTDRGRDLLLVIYDLARIEGEELEDGKLRLTGKNWRATISLTNVGNKPALIGVFEVRQAPKL